MIVDLKPYQEYKDSGLPWLGHVPGHWGKRRMKFLFKERVQNGFPDEPLLAATQNKGVVRKEDYGTRTVTATKDFHLLKLVQTGDFVISLRSFEGGIEVAHCRGIISPAYTILEPGRDAKQSYYSRFFKSPAFISSLTLFVTGIREGQNIDYERLSRAYMPLPPAEEQEAIGRFLDWANGRLERAIRAKRKELALISEMLSVVTENALQLEGTRRLRLSVVAEVMSRPIDRRASQSYTRVGLYNRGRGIFHKAPTDGAELGDSDFIWIEAGDLVISGQFAWEGAIALARSKDSGCVASHRYPILRGHEEYASSAVLFALFRTSYGAMLLDHHSRGAAGRNRPLNAERLLKETVPIPPISAQAEITELLDKEYAVAQSLAQTVRFINEYRTRLVADVVTGKLDVREAARLLSNESEEPVASSELDTDDAEEIELDPSEEA